MALLIFFGHLCVCVRHTLLLLSVCNRSDHEVQQVVRCGLATYVVGLLGGNSGGARVLARDGLRVGGVCWRL